MDILNIVILGIVQGLTEFLPVSSSGHLVLMQQLLGLHEPELLFDICVHIGTLAAVCVVFLRDILGLMKTTFRLPHLLRSSANVRSLLKTNDEVRMVVLILVGSIPTAFLGLLFHEIADQLFSSIWVVGVTLLVTGTLLWFTSKLPQSGRNVSAMSIRDALMIGLIQGLAILPGISRSGSTISVALYLGIDRKLAGRYSFLLSIPAIVGALVISLDSSKISSSISAQLIILGTLIASVVGYLALKLLLWFVNKGQLNYFSPYCWILGVGALLWAMF